MGEITDEWLNREIHPLPCTNISIAAGKFTQADELRAVCQDRSLIQWFKHSPNASLWTKPKTKPVPLSVLAVTWHTWHVPGCWRQPEQFKCLFMTLPFLVKEMTSDSFSVTKSLPELQGFTETAVRFSPNAWRAKAGDGVAAVPAGLPSNIHHNICVEAQRETLMEGREGAKFTALFLQVFCSRNSWVYFCILRFWVCGRDIKRWWYLQVTAACGSSPSWAKGLGMARTLEWMCSLVQCVKAGRGAA